MPPNNFLIPTAAAEEARDITKTSAVDDCHDDARGILLNRKLKNFLNATEEECKNLDLNNNVVVSSEKTEEPPKEDFKIELAWINIIGFVFLHYWFAKGFLYSGLNLPTLFHVIVGICTGIGITGGAHRLWSHGSYKANLPLRILLAFFQTVAFQNSIYEWSRDHRAHHKFTDTNADPHSASRGFFFAHMGWLLCKKHPDVKKFGQKVDMSDLERDPVVAFQRKYFAILMPVCHTVIPVALSSYLFGLPLYISFCMNCFRYVTVLHFTWLVNSYAHFFGNKPFDENIKPTDSYTVALLAFGEGWHNYHHVFPYDYKTSEHGKYWCNYTTGFIDFMASIGWATDLKTMNPDLVKKRAMRTGDGSFISARIEQIEKSHDDNNKSFNELCDTLIWGWQDKLVTEAEKNDVTIINRTGTY